MFSQKISLAKNDDLRRVLLVGGEGGEGRLDLQWYVHDSYNISFLGEAKELRQVS